MSPHQDGSSGTSSGDLAKCASSSHPEARRACPKIRSKHNTSYQTRIRPGYKCMLWLSEDQGNLIVRGQNSDKLATSSSPFRVFQIVARPGYWPVPDVNLNLVPYSALLVRTVKKANCKLLAPVFWTAFHTDSLRVETATTWEFLTLACSINMAIVVVERSL